MYLASYSTRSNHNDWLIDIGASFHMTPHREWFSEYENYDGGEVHLGDDRPVRIIGHGRVKVLMHDGRVRSFPGVMHIPSLARNSIYVSKMTDADVDCSCNKTSCKMVCRSMVLAQGVWAETLYKLLGSTMINECSNSSISDTKSNGTSVDKSTLWYRRMGHIGEKRFVYFIHKRYG